MIARAVTLLLLSSMVLTAQDVGLTATTEKQDLRLGEPVIVTVTARLGIEIDSIGPFAVDSVGLFEVLGYTSREEDLSWSFELMTIDTGMVFLPPIAFGYVATGDTVHRTAYANSLMFRVAGIEVAQDADIKDIKPPMNAPWGWGDIWPYLLAAGLAGGGWFIYRKYFRKDAEGPEQETYRPPAAPAHITALRELRDLEEKKLWQQGSTKAYYSECTEIIRRFFEGRFDFPALELTSEETLFELQKRDAGQVDAATLRTFFDRADIVKFAKGQPTPEEHAQELAIAYEIVRSMAVKLPETTAIKETADVG